MTAHTRINQPEAARARPNLGGNRMTTQSDLDNTTGDEILAAGLSAAERMRAQIAAIERSRDEQPERLTKARERADLARDWALVEEPWSQLITALPAVDSTGKRTGNAIALPSILAKELMGARLAFDMLDCGDDFDRLDDVQNRYFTELQGDTGLLFLVSMAALSTIASVVVPQILDEIEQHGNNYDARVLLAEARTKAWQGRVSDLQATEQ